MSALKKSFRELLRYPSAILGMAIILFLLGVSVYALATIPYSEAIRLWRGGEEVWYQNPKYAPPAWFNYFSNKKKPVSFAVRTTDGSMTKTTTPSSDPNISTVDITYAFDYAYDDVPQELMIYFTSQYEEKFTFASVSWITPDGRTIRIADMAVEHTQNFRFSQDQKLQKRLKTDHVMQALFVDPESSTQKPLKGQYQLVISGTAFEKDASIDAEFVLHGELFGAAGTDKYRRDLLLPLLYGTPIALAFGLLAALGTSLLTMVIAATGTWYGGWLDELIQRVTEVNLVLPFLAILIMVGTFYSRSIWLMLGVTILLSIFSGSIKTYRSIFMQSKESSYIEAARAYGASSSRIIFSYLIPRMVPLLIPALVSSIPSFVFLEASLAVLGLGDPVLPTWGKVINDAFYDGALYQGRYYWVLEPAILLMITGFGFALLGFALDRIFNPRLRDI
ncbi:MAG: ABC transporter permease [Chloroflexi bacterium GWB2_49_20]|nr:MAG: ABC transporter permease [Chloroflexi bacterium GWB2_49_20]OGN77823.1 MAG: ABC transporter permease [Chloroflexi bacterium GWC2_49_37]OGN86136.1 MAG: ABC transporter permease [Chloroflexi bacterium GWD2_49_16]HCM96231.1 ABC transporter permease [Anaerolineae bacterium]